MSNHIQRALQGVLNTAGQATAALTAARELLFRKFTYNEMRWLNDAAVTGTVAVTEVAIGSIKMPQRLIEAKYIPSSGAVTGGATHYFTLVISARLADSPYTARAMITYAADTSTTDDAAQWNEKDLLSYASATASDLDVAEGEVITAAVTKTGTNGMTFPAGTVELRFRPRDT